MNSRNPKIEKSENRKIREYKIVRAKFGVRRSFPVEKNLIAFPSSYLVETSSSAVTGILSDL